METEINKLLPLASKIAREFSNIPALPHAEIEMVAQEALAQAARLFDPAKGDFTAYAVRAMRNALRDLYERQVRHHQHHVYDLDRMTTQFTTPEVRIQQVAALDFPLADQAAAALESGKRLEMAMNTLSPRLRQVAEGIRDGKSNHIAKSELPSVSPDRPLTNSPVPSSPLSAKSLPPCLLKTSLNPQPFHPNVHL